MTDKPTLAYLKKTLGLREDALKREECPYDRRVIESHIAELKQDIAALEKPARIEFSNNPPCGGA